MWREVYVILLVLATAQLPQFVWTSGWHLWAYRHDTEARKKHMESIRQSLPRAIGTGIVVVVLIVLMLIDSSTTNRIEADRQQKLVDAVTAQTEAVNAQTKALLAFLERMSPQITDNTSIAR
jgi:sensor domain CHASE-containing protein